MGWPFGVIAIAISLLLLCICISASLPFLSLLSFPLYNHFSPPHLPTLISLSHSLTCKRLYICGEQRLQWRHHSEFHRRQFSSQITPSNPLLSLSILFQVYISPLSLPPALNLSFAPAKFKNCSK